MAKTINKIVKTLITSDFYLNLGWGFLSPLFAIFILERISSNNPTEAVKIAGLAALFYWIPKSLFQIPIGIYLDKNHGEKDDFWFMVFGTFIAGLIPIGYLVSNAPWQIYLLQTLYAAGMAMAIPSWLAIFTRHVDDGKEAFEWGMESTSIGIGAGVAGGLSGILVAFFGFTTLFICVSTFTMLAVITLLSVRKSIFYKSRRSGSFSGTKMVVEP